MSEITTITTPFILNISVNCYLVQTEQGFILIDTAKAGMRPRIEQALEQAGCTAGKLTLIVLTHGDFDHCGNAAYLRQKYSTRIALHPDDSGMVEKGDMFWNRKTPNPILKALFGLIFHLDPADRFQADVALAEGGTLGQYGLDARIIRLPGHSKGNVGILTRDGDLFCGDLLANTNKPDLWSIMDDKSEAYASVEKLKGLDIKTVYPGHGKPFSFAAFLQTYQPPATVTA